MPAFTWLGDTDRAAVVEHLATLDPADRRLRFGLAQAEPMWIESMADHLLRQPGNYGLWDVQRQRLRVLGCCAPTTDPATADFALSASPLVREGATRQTAHWLLPQLAIRGYQRAQLFLFVHDDQLVWRAERLGLDLRVVRGEGRVRIDITRDDLALDHTLIALEQLVTAARETARGDRPQRGNAGWASGGRRSM